MGRETAASARLLTWLPPSLFVVVAFHAVYLAPLRAAERVVPMLSIEERSQLIHKLKALPDKTRDEKAFLDANPSSTWIDFARTQNGPFKTQDILRIKPRPGRSARQWEFCDPRRTVPALPPKVVYQNEGIVGVESGRSAQPLTIHIMDDDLDALAKGQLEFRREWVAFARGL
jgi:hypothetical protein